MAGISIKVVIAGRTYPLTIRPEEEEAIRAAADKINRTVKGLQENYAVKDMQDLLAMTALQQAVQHAQSPQTEPASPKLDPQLVEKLKEIDRQLGD